ncbi:MAG: ABC transporter ATP-binding protein [Candidatus Omnitrophica bacterium]|nr:ABC transporter ATP-binding protein [Candidatus Omnitrophota bacterium]
MRIIEFNNVWEKYRIKFVRDRKVSWEEIWALSNIDFTVNKGEVIGIIGENGAGKTTLLKLIAGMFAPDRGDISVRGKVSVLMELGAGFNPEFTGRENVILNARIYGLDTDIVEQQMEKIVEFADIGKFIDAPVKYYSQGMYTRLAFALAIFVEPDILLIDDILSVGDADAQKKCIDKVFKLKESGKTIILVSHDMHMISRLCDRVILLDKGKLIDRGNPAEIIYHYLETVGDKSGIAVLEKDKLRLVFNNGRITFSYAGVPLTKEFGGYVAYFVSSLGSWLSSFDLFWKISHFSANKIVAEGEYKGRGPSQVWVLEFSESRLCWQVKIKDKDVRDPHIDLLLNPQYKKWLNLDQGGGFPSFISKSTWQNLGLANFPQAMVGLTADLEVKSCPSFVLTAEDKDTQIRLFNTGYDQEGRIIQLDLKLAGDNLFFLKIFPEKNIFEEYIKKEKDIFEESIKKVNQQLALEKEAQQVRLRDLSTFAWGNFSLFADKEEKSLKLYFKNKEVTKKEGFHISFLINNIWYDTTSADWQITKEKEVFIIKLFWKVFDFKQTWKFSVKNGGLLWNLNSIVKKTFNPEIMKIGLLLISEYKTFFCGYQQEDFPDKFSSWQDMSLKDPKARCFGLRKQTSLPAIALDNNESFDCIVQNSDEENSCRVLQLSLPRQSFIQKNTSFGVQLSLLEEESPIDHYLKQERQDHLLRQQEAKRLLSAKSTISKDNFRFFVDKEEKSLRIYFKDKEITKGAGLHSSLCVFGKWFHREETRWQTKKISDEEVVLILSYDSLPLLQIFSLSFKRKGILRVKVEMEISEQIHLSDHHLKLELQDDYNNWDTGYEQGNFFIDRYVDEIGPIRLKDNRISNILLRSNNESKIPKMLLKIISQIDRRIINLYKRRSEDGECVGLCSPLIVSKKEELVKPGKYTYFEGEIIFGKEAKLEREASRVDIVELKKDDIRFVFDRGRVKIFWKEEELTSELGIYTSLRSKGIWQDSYQAAWEIEHKAKEKIVATGGWPYLPISQTWKLELLGKNSISWQVDMEIYGEVNLEIEQASVMISSKYRNWEIPSFNSGKFLDVYVKNHDILPFRFWSGDANKIAAVSECFPSIIFKSERQDKEMQAVIENTGILYRARLLQYQSTSNNAILPGKYPYFRGMIEIETRK